MSRSFMAVSAVLVSILSVNVFAGGYASQTRPNPGRQPIVHSDTAVAVPDQNCAYSNDPYERPEVITDRSPLFAGFCIDSNRRRAPTVFMDQTKDGLTPVSNIRHRDQFWIGYLPLSDDAIQQINFLVVRVNFGVGVAGHGQLEIIFKKPVTIRLQTDESKVETIDRIYYSVEAVTVAEFKQQGFVNKAAITLLTLGTGEFPLLGRLATEQQRQSEDADGGEFWKYERYPMTFAPGEKGELVTNALIQADKYASARPFQIFEKNCVGTLVGLVDELPRIKAMNLPAYHPEVKPDMSLGVAIEDLKKRGLIDKPEKITDAKIQ